jgi:DNA-damage-inducible protein J
MSANSLVTTRIEQSIKDEASIVLESIGLTLSDAVRLLLTNIASTHKFPLNIEIPNKETIIAIKEARTKKLQSFNTLDSLLVDLHADD